MARMKVLIDTDPGVDDALAILMAHAHADVVALSIAAGNVGLAPHRGQCAEAGRDDRRRRRRCSPDAPTPLVLPAEDAGVRARQRTASATPATCRARAQPKTNTRRSPLLRLSHEHAGKLVTVVAIAPLTNLALALQTRSDAAAARCEARHHGRRRDRARQYAARAGRIQHRLRSGSRARRVLVVAAIHAGRLGGDDAPRHRVRTPAALARRRRSRARASTQRSRARRATGRASAVGRRCWWPMRWPWPWRCSRKSSRAPKSATSRSNSTAR